ncbi:AraC family transcriptional regulator [Dyella thiooxydans]|uniref:AraC family transcriptional regulator n=1 Tax=Dyella thiooxydans TaxID=445710 RepID=A0A160N3E0_9GAMM|nr:helix-turn-helix domain-containing protein [Dyella thiooxydans]AND70486.1 AraC family transcriptional regulator [Dyella thiooxydans]
MHRIGFYLYPGHQILDFAGPFGAFESAAKIAGRALYALEVLSQGGGPVRGSGGAVVESLPAARPDLDTLIVVGGDLAPMRAPGDIAAVRALAGKTARVASVCTGAFLLAEAGLLDGRRATTHWRVAHLLQQDYPRVRVEADHIFIADKSIWTSAGITAGIDLALALIEADHGADMAREVARELVVYYRRSGGQSQFSSLSQMEPSSDRIRLALAFARDHLCEPLDVQRLAEAVHLSPRQFSRAFRRETGETPARAVERLRVEAALARLQDGAEPVESIARAVGFTDPERMRRAFVKLHGVPPQAIRRAART